MKSGTIGQFVLVVAGALLLAGGVALSWRAPAHIDELGWLSLGLAIVITAALIGGHIAGRFGQAAVLGELFAGMLLGALAGTAKLEFIAADPFLDILARIGMLLLMFEVGVDLSARDLFSVGPSALLVAVI